MTPRELQEWIVYDQLEPFGEIRQDWRFAYLIANIANMVRTKDQTPFSALDFAPTSVQNWSKLLSTFGKTEDEIAGPPVHPNVAIFEEIMSANVDNRTA